MKTSRPESLICEQQAKFVQERVSSVESNMAKVCSTFSQFTTKAARLRDANDELSIALNSYSESETINKTLKSGLLEMANTMICLADIREQEVQLLDRRVMEVLTQHQSLCGRAKEELKRILATREKEVSHQRQLDKLIQRNPHNRHQITKAEAELVKARNEVSRSQKALEELVDTFEKRKLKDLKSSMLDFIKIELALHAKAIELYTKAYNDVSDIDEEQDLEELKNAVASDSARLETVKRTSLRSSSLQSLANIFSTPQKSQKIKTRSPASDSPNIEAEVKAVDLTSRIVSLRDDSDEDQLSSPFTAGPSQKHSFHT